MFDWIDLHFYPSQAAGFSRLDIELASWKGNKMTREDRVNIIDTDCWLPGKEITIPIDNDRRKLEVVFMSSLGCIWMRIADGTCEGTV